MRSEKAFAVTNTGDIKMSGKFLARASALSLAVFLAACGGDENSTPIVNVNTGQDDTTTGGGTTSPDDTNTDDTGTGGTDTDNNPQARLILGSNVSGTFVKGDISTDLTSLTVGSETNGSTRIALQIVDPENDNALATGIENTVRFFSGCLAAGWAEMDNSQITTEAGTVLATYTPLAACAGNDDVLYAKLNEDSENLAKVTFSVSPAGGTTTPGTTEVGSLDAAGTFHPGVIRVEQPALVLDASNQA